MNSDSPNKPKIAVVAVHGVSDQKPYESAKAIANLLLDPTTNNQGNYTPFYEKFFRLRVNPVRVKNDRSSYTKCSVKNQSWQSKFKNWWLSFLPNERGDLIHQRLNTPLDELDITSFDDVDLDFTRDRLKNYQTSTVYDTLRLEGEQIASDGNTKKVHVYEMHWADLSRLGAGLLHIFGGLFQLLFHFSSMGRPIVDSARIKIRETPDLCDRSLDNLLKWWGRFQVGTGLMLSLLIPVVNLYVLIVAFSSLPVTKIPQKELPVATNIILGIAIAILTLKFLVSQAKKSVNRRKKRANRSQKKQFLRNKIKFSSRLISALPIAIGIAVTLLLNPLLKIIGAKYSCLITLICSHLITLIWYFLLIGLCWIVIIRPFDRHRPGTKKFFIAIGILSLLSSFYLYNFQTTNNLSEKIIGTSLNLVEIFYFILCLAWFSFSLFCLITIGLWLVSFVRLFMRANKVYSHRSRVKRKLLINFWQSLVITQLSLIVPAALFLFVTLILWQVLANVSDSLFYQTQFYKPFIFHFLSQIPAGDSQIFTQIPISEPQTFSQISIDNLQNWIQIAEFNSDFCSQTLTCNSEFFSQTLKLSPLDSFQGILTPSELFHRLILFAHSPVSDRISLILIAVLGISLCALFPAVWTDIMPEKKTDESRSIGLGNWLTNGYSTIIISIGLLIPVAPTLGLYSSILTISEIFDPKPLSETPVLFTIALSLFTASTAGVIIFNKGVNKIIQSVLDTVLDVDNYLRLYPQNDTPRSRIFARYTSLLRYLYQWRDPEDNQPYDGIIIVSHSQGTVITADLLRLLSVDADCTLESSPAKPPIYVFTMGSPLRQLYSFAFPNLYDWISHPKKFANGLKNLNVKEWINAYCSGDYIGRNIWASNNNKNLYKLLRKKSRSSKYRSRESMQIREYCVGGGGHIHYWNTNAPEIAAEIDSAISKIT